MAVVHAPHCDQADDGTADPLSEMEHAFDLVVEASGSRSGILTALQLCRPMGTLVGFSCVQRDGRARYSCSECRVALKHMATCYTIEAVGACASSASLNLTAQGSVL